jgi:hypothetical protein
VTLGEQIIHHYDRQLVDEKHRLGKQETCNFSYGRRFFISRICAGMTKHVRPLRKEQFCC